jgi:CheY-like chemotaxis protein
MTKPKLLMIEPDKFLRDVYQKRFTEADVDFIGMDCAEADIVDRVAELKPSLISITVLLYKTMGGKLVTMPDGYTIVEQLKKDARTKDIPVAFLSNMGMPEDIKKAKEVGAVAYYIPAKIIPSELVKEYSKWLKPQ